MYLWQPRRKCFNSAALVLRRDLERRKRTRIAKHSDQSPIKYCAIIPSDSIVPSRLRANARNKLTLTVAMQPPNSSNPRSQMSPKFKPLIVSAAHFSPRNIIRACHRPKTALPDAYGIIHMSQ